MFGNSEPISEQFFKEPQSQDAARNNNKENTMKTPRIVRLGQSLSLILIFAVIGASSLSLAKTNRYMNALVDMTQSQPSSMFF
jgi:hypothetical protein